MPMAEGFTLDCVLFPVRKASFQTNGRELWLVVDCGPSSPLDPEHDWAYLTPKLYADSAPIALDPDTERCEVATDDGWLGDEPLLALYVHEHEPVTRCRGRLRRDRDGYRLELEGEAEVMGVPFPFALATSIEREPWPVEEPRFLR